jgi:hypothetical protein
VGNVKKGHLVGLIAIGFLLVFVVMLRSQPGNPRVDSFIKALSTFPNIDSAKAAFQAAKFTDAERKQLENQLRNPIYKPHIARLAGTAAKKTFPLKPVRQTIASRKEAQSRRIDGINQKVRSEVQRFMAVSAKVSATAQSVLGTPPKITSLTPQDTIEPGQYLMIRGTNFLPQGSVQFTFGSSSFTGTVETWTDDLIFAKLPSNVQGIPATQGNVTVRKQNSMSRADAVINFVPRWDYADIVSEELRYDSNPYDPILAFIRFCVNPASIWCSTYSMRFPEIPGYALKNSWVIDEVHYNSDSQVQANDDQEYHGFVGWEELPDETWGELCQGLFNPAPIYCTVCIKGPLGVPYK